MALLLCPDATLSFWNIFDFSLAPHVLFYSYIPTVAMSLFLGFFILFKNKFSLVSKLLLLIAVSFCLWVLNIIIQWIAAPVNIVMLAWQLTALFEITIFISSLYFVYVFIEKKDISISLKTIFSLIIILVATFLPTKFNIRYFDIANCEGQIGPLWLVLYSLEIFIIAWVIYVCLKKYKLEKGLFKKQVLYLMFGLVIFLGLFSWSNIVGELTKYYQLNLVGPIGMVVFIGFLAYMVVEFKTFDIKLLATKALVWSLWLLIAAQFLFIKNPTNFYLVGITLSVAIVFGSWLIKSVEYEVKTRERIQRLVEALRHANIELKRLDELKSEFISIASHQLRGPLTVIKGYISMILEGTFGKISQEAEKPLKDVYYSNEKMIGLVNELLNVSRIEKGKITLVFKELNLNDFVKNVINELQWKASEKKIELRFKPGTIPSAFFDDDKMRHAVYNLIDNAIKYTDKGYVEVSTKFEDGKIFISVKDTGIGVTSEEQNKIFKRFTRGDEALRLHPEGTGLGLFLVKQIVEAHKGRVWAESGGRYKGSTFIIELPILKGIKESTVEI